MTQHPHLFCETAPHDLDVDSWLYKPGIYTAIRPYGEDSHYMGMGKNLDIQALEKYLTRPPGEIVAHIPMTDVSASEAEGRLIFSLPEWIVSGAEYGATGLQSVRVSIWQKALMEGEIVWLRRRLYRTSPVASWSLVQSMSASLISVLVP